jgi:hemoglobin
MTTMYDRLGGADAVAKVVDVFYDQHVLRDPDPELVALFTDRDVAVIKGHQQGLLTAILGGPDRYQGRSMRQAHGRLGITDESFDKIVAHLVATLTELDVPAVMIQEIGARLLPLRGHIVTA